MSQLRLPGPDDLSELPSGRSGRAIATVDLTGPGRGLVDQGEGIQRLGSGLRQREAVSRREADFEARKAKAEQERNEEFGVQSRLFDFKQAQAERFVSEAQKMQPGGVGFADQFMAGLDKDAKQLWDSSVPDRLKPEYDLKFRELRGLYSGAVDAAVGVEKTRFAKERIDVTGDITLDQIKVDPDNWQALTGEHEKLIANAPLSEIDKSIELQNTRKRMAVGILEARKIKYGAQEAVKGLLPEGQVGGSGLVDRIVHVESGGDPTIGATTSSAVGLGQFIKGTWQAFLADRHPELLGAGRDFRRDPDLSKEAVAWYAQKNTAVLTGAGHQATDGNLYLAHFLGPQGAVDMLSANQMRTAASVNPSAAAANKSIFYNKDGSAKSAADVVAWASRKMGGTGPVRTGGEVAPEYAALSFEDRLKLYNDTIKQNADDTTDRVADYSAYLRSGQPEDPNKFPLPDLQRALGPEQGQAVRDQLDQDAAFGQDYRSVSTASREEIAALRAERGALLASPIEFRENAKNMAILDEAIAARDTAIKKDPSGYVMQSFPEVRGAWENVEPGGEGYSSALRKTAEAEARLGVPPQNMALLPTDHAKQVVANFANPDASEGDRLGAVTAAIFSTQDREQQQAIFQQLVKEGLPPMTEGALDAAARGDEGAARRLLRAALIDPSKIGKIPKTPDEIKEQIQTDVLDNDEIGGVAYGLAFGDVSNFERASRDSELMLRSVQMRLAEGKDLVTAVADTKKDLFGDKQVLNLSNAKLVVDKDVDGNAVEMGLGAVAPRFRKALEDALSPPELTAGLKTSDSSMAIADAAAQNAIERFMSEGVFRNVNGGIGLFDVYSGQFVAGANGKPLVVPLEEVLHRAQPPVDVPAAAPLPKEGEGIDPFRSMSVDTGTHDNPTHLPALEEYVTGNRMIRSGADGEHVTQLQMFLNQAGIRNSDGEVLEEDGHFGRRTSEAVKAFQSEHGLKPDGVVGPRTMAVIKSELSPDVNNPERASERASPAGNLPPHRSEATDRVEPKDVNAQPFKISPKELNARQQNIVNYANARIQRGEDTRESFRELFASENIPFTAAPAPKELNAQQVAVVTLAKRQIAAGMASPTDYREALAKLGLPLSILTQ